MRWQSLCVALAVFGVEATLAQASMNGPEIKPWKVPRTEHGHPDLQGLWTNATITPLERSSEFGDRRQLTTEEATAQERGNARTVTQAAMPSDLTRDLPRAADGVGNYNNFWFDRGTKVVRVNGEYRSSMVIDPSNGRIPPFRPDMRAAPTRRGGTDGPEARSLGERCLIFGSSASPPMLPVGYNNHYQIVQTKDAVMIYAEMMHDVRVVRLNGRHGPSSVRKWMGDSIGRYEGDTLVVETKYFTNHEDFRGATPDRTVTERFTRANVGELNYRATVEDASLTRPWTLEYSFGAMSELIYEYACHEGNYALHGILSGARAEERRSN